MNQYYNDAFRQMLVERAAQEALARRASRLLPRDWRHDLPLGAETGAPADPRRPPGPQAMLMQEEAPPRLERFRMRPEERQDYFDQFQDPNLYRDVPREKIPPSMRPPIEVPPMEPQFYEDNWRNRIT
jgi:hypothetical protein